MVFLLPAITEKALAINHATVEGTCAGQPCQFTFIRNGLSAGSWLAGFEPPTGTHTSPIKWMTRGGEPGGSPVGNEEGYLTYEVGKHTEPTACPFREEGQRCEAGYHAKLNFHNPLFGKNTCSVEIYNPSGQIQAAGKGPVTGSCNAGQGNPATVTYTLNSEYN